MCSFMCTSAAGSSFNILTLTPLCGELAGSVGDPGLLHCSSVRICNQMFFFSKKVSQHYVQGLFWKVGSLHYLLVMLQWARAIKKSDLCISAPVNVSVGNRISAAEMETL